MKTKGEEDPGIGTALVSRRQILKAALAAGGLAAAGAGLRLDAPAPGARVLSVEEMELVGALAEVMFPGDPFPVDGLAAGVPREMDRLAAEFLAEPNRSGFRYLLRTIEWGTLASRGVRFSQLSREDRLEVLEVWSDPNVLLRRVGSDSLRLLMGMAYFSNPQVLARIGWRLGCAEQWPYPGEKT